MKKLILILSITIFLTPAFAQKSEKVIRDTVGLRIYYTLAKKQKKDLMPYRTDTMLLDIGKSISRFYDPARLKRDSTIFALVSPANQNNIKEMHVLKDEGTSSMEQMEGTISSMSTEGESYQIIKDKSGNITVFDYGALQITKLQHEDKLGKLDWQLTEGTDTIASYTCQKATLNFRGRHYTAWFTLDIPSNEGPWKFSGLPGLILKIEDDDQLFSFTMIGLTQPKDPILIEVEKADYLKISRKDYNEQLQKRGAGIKANFTDGKLVIGSISGKHTPTLMELE